MTCEDLQHETYLCLNRKGPSRKFICEDVYSDLVGAAISWLGGLCLYNGTGPLVGVLLGLPLCKNCGWLGVMGLLYCAADVGPSMCGAWLGQLAFGPFPTAFGSVAVAFAWMVRAIFRMDIGFCIGIMLRPLASSSVVGY